MTTQPPSKHDAPNAGLLDVLRSWWRRRSQVDDASVLSSMPPVPTTVLREAGDSDWTPPPAGELPRWTADTDQPYTRTPTSVSDSERAALKAMIERKRRNDFVRKREFDLLRRARREGLSLEQLHVLGANTRLDDDEPLEEVILLDPQVRDKINQVEEQMLVGPNAAVRPFNPILRGQAVTEAASVLSDSPSSAHNSNNNGSRVPPSSNSEQTTLGAPGLLLPETAMPPHQQRGYNPETVPGQISHFDPQVDGAKVEKRLMATGETLWVPAQPGQPLPGSRPAADAPGHGPISVATALAPPPDHPLPQGWMHSQNHWVEATERADPRLEDVIRAYSQGRLEAVERQLSGLTQMLTQAGRDDNLWQTWLDFLQVTHQRRRFDEQAQQYALNFSRPIPSWQVEGPAGDDSEILSRFLAPTHINWACPPELTGSAIAELDAKSQEWGSWVVLDWSALNSLDMEAASGLARLVRLWINRSLDMRWPGGDRLLALVEHQVAHHPVTVGFAWRQLRAAVLNLLDRRDPFEDALSAYAREREGSNLPDLRSWVVPMARVALISQDDLDAANRGGPALRGALRGLLNDSLARLQPKGVGPWLVDASGVVWIDGAAARSLCDWARAHHAAGSPVQFQGINRLAAYFLQAHGLHEVAYMQLRRI